MKDYIKKNKWMLGSIAAFLTGFLIIEIFASVKYGFKDQQSEWTVWGIMTVAYLIIFTIDYKRKSK